jgi:D-xylono/L-arabinono-1,4-lactonase
MQPELIADYQCICGEGPLWHPTEKRLYWADIGNGRIFRYDPASGQHEQVYGGEALGGFTFQADGSLLLFGSKGAVRVWRDGVLTTRIAFLPGEENGMFNDVSADPQGRVFCGMLDLGGGEGRLYRLDSDGSLQVVLQGVRLSNGIGFTPDHRGIYYTDSLRRDIYYFDYEQSTGAISGQRLFVHASDEDGLPDGLTVDAEGHVWSAHWDGSCVIRYDPGGREVARLVFPAKQVSSVMFGGDDYADLYVTTAGADDRAQNGPGAGALFRVRPGIRGVPEFLTRIWL